MVFFFCISLNSFMVFCISLFLYSLLSMVMVFGINLVFFIFWKILFMFIGCVGVGLFLDCCGLLLFFMVVVVEGLLFSLSFFSSVFLMIFCVFCLGCCCCFLVEVLDNFLLCFGGGGSGLFLGLVLKLSVWSNVLFFFFCFVLWIICWCWLLVE